MSEGQPALKAVGTSLIIAGMAAEKRRRDLADMAAGRVNAVRKTNGAPILAWGGEKVRVNEVPIVRITWALGRRLASRRLTSARWAPVALGFERAAVLLPIALLAACTSAPPLKHDSLAFLESGQVSRDDVRAHLGASATAFERGHVLAYRLRRTGDGYDVVAPKNNGYGLGWEGVDYDLVLAFDDDGILQEHSLVAIRGIPSPK